MLDRTHTFRRTAFWATLASAAHLACQCGVAMAIARLGSPEMLGQFSLGLAIATPMSLFADRSIRALQATAGPDDLPLQDYLGYRLVLAMLACTAIGGWLLLRPFSWSTSQIILLVMLIKGAEGVSQVFYGAMHRHERMDLIGRSQLLKGTAFVGLVAFGLQAQLALSQALWAVLLVYVVVAQVHDQVGAQRLLAMADRSKKVRLITIPNFSPEAFWRLLRLAFPLSVAAFLVALNANLPRYVLTAWHGEATLGIFSMLFYFSVPVTILVSGVTQAAVPRLASMYRQGRNLRRAYRKLAAFGLLTGLLATLLAGATAAQILPRLVDATYARHWPLLVALLGASTVGYVALVPATALTAQRQFKRATLNCTCSTVACVLSSWLFIPSLGMYGAALAMLTTNLVHGFSAWWLLRPSRAPAAPPPHPAPGGVPLGLASPPPQTARP